MQLWTTLTLCWIFSTFFLVIQSFKMADSFGQTDWILIESHPPVWHTLHAKKLRLTAAFPSKAQLFFPDKNFTHIVTSRIWHDQSITLHRHGRVLSCDYINTPFQNHQTKEEKSGVEKGMWMLSQLVSRRERVSFTYESNQDFFPPRASFKWFWK